MALTTAQLNAHLRQIALVQLDNEGRDGLRALLRACVEYARGTAAGSPEREAANTIATFAAERVLGRSLTAQDRHWLVNHAGPEAHEAAAGVIA